MVEQMVADEEMQRTVAANTRENFEYVGGPAVDKALIDRHMGHRHFVEQVFADPELHAFLRRQVLDAAFRQIKEAS